MMLLRNTAVVVIATALLAFVTVSMAAERVIKVFKR